MIGIAIITAAADVNATSTEYLVLNAFRPKGTVRSLSFVIIIVGSMKLFQLDIKLNMMIEFIAGLIKGMII